LLFITIYFIVNISPASRTIQWEVGSNQLGGFTAAVNDTLIFSYQSGHTVQEMADGTHFDNCDFTGAELQNDANHPETGPVTYLFQEDDVDKIVYFACSIDSHCLSGLKIAINVVQTGGNTAGSTPTTTTGQAFKTNPTSLLFFTSIVAMIISIGCILLF